MTPKPPNSSNYKDCGLPWTTVPLRDKNALIFSIGLLCETAWVNWRCFWVDESSPTVGDKTEALTAASGGAAEQQTSGGELRMPAQRSHHTNTHSDLHSSAYLKMLRVMPEYIPCYLICTVHTAWVECSVWARAHVWFTVCVCVYGGARETEQWLHCG